MPSNGMSLFILALLGLNTLYLVHDSTGDLTLVADRAGLLFAANLPWLYVLGAKNQPVKALTGHSYENLNVLHRRLGEWMCFLALGHFAGFVAGWYRVLRPLGISFVHFVTIPAVAFGLGAWVCYEGLYFTSLAGFRRGWYEVFLGTHVVLQVVALGCLWMHFHFARGYIGVALLVYVVDRLVYRIGGKTRAFEADLTVLEDGETTLVSVNWSLPPTTTTSSSAMRQRIWVRNMRHGWQPSAHVFITLPHLSRGHRFQAHPMTIASAAPPSSSSSSSDQRHAWLNLIVRAQGGFSRDLLHHARANPRTKVLLDGPYGSLHALEMLRDSDKAVVIAGGSGIAVAYPVVWALLHPEDSGGGVDDDAERQIARDDRREITLVWIVQDASHLSWLDAARLEELSAKGAKVVVPPPTRKSGRPDVRGLLRGAVAEDADGDGWSSSVGVVVSGPDGLNRSVRNFCAEMVREGLDVCVEVEKFGW
jgi:NAD(P)H-flavin reductase